MNKLIQLSWDELFREILSDKKPDITLTLYNIQTGDSYSPYEMTIENILDIRYGRRADVIPKDWVIFKLEELKEGANRDI